MHTLPQRVLGRAGPAVSALGLGAGSIGTPDIPEGEAARLLHGALDAGVSLIDTACSYGLSEERIGRHLAGRRDAFTLSTKVGYGVEGLPDWTAPCVAAGVDRALRVLRTDRIDLLFLHSCPAPLVERGALIAPLEQARAAGKVRAIGYSGDGDALEQAIRSGRFDVVQCSVSLVDRDALTAAVPEARARGIGILAKRPLATAPWYARGPEPAETPGGEPAPDRVEYRGRWTALRAAAGDPFAAADWFTLFVRFAAHAPGVGACLLGTRSLEHLRSAAAAVAEGPLPDSVAAALAAAYESASAGRGWPGVV